MTTSVQQYETLNTFNTFIEEIYTPLLKCTTVRQVPAASKSDAQEEVLAQKKNLQTKTKVIRKGKKYSHKRG